MNKDVLRLLTSGRILMCKQSTDKRDFFIIGDVLHQSIASHVPARPFLYDRCLSQVIVRGSAVMLTLTSIDGTGLKGNKHMQLAQVTHCVVSSVLRLLLRTGVGRASLSCRRLAKKRGLKLHVPVYHQHHVFYM